ncbi:MAG: hypothetical protein AAB215_06490 [Planctomycetota bacterium]
MGTSVLSEIPAERFTYAELFALAIAEAGRPLTPAEAAALLLARGVKNRGAAAALARALRVVARPPLLGPCEDGTVRLLDDTPRFQALLSKLETHLRHAAAQAEEARTQERQDRRCDEEDGLANLAYLASEKRFLRAIFERSRLRGACTLDPDAKAFREYGPGDLDALRLDLSRADLLVGMGIERDLERIGIGEGARRIDLTPPIRSKRIGASGRLVRFTPDQILRSNLRIRKPLSDPERIASYARRGQEGRLFQRLHSDLKTLYALHQYGIRHNYLMLHVGCIHEYRGVEWNVGCEPTIYELLDQAIAEKRKTEIVYGSLPPFEDEWARAVDFAPLELTGDWVRGTSPEWDREASLYLSEIFAVRLPGDPFAPPGPDDFPED